MDRAEFDASTQKRSGNGTPGGIRVAVHNEFYRAPAYALAIASLKPPEFPLAIGVFRAVETATYEALPQGQVAGAIARRGAGSLHDLLHSGDTWAVEEN
jgi:2-oxoglutarate ferredoxin oxidoreductase subunit beta